MLLPLCMLYGCGDHASSFACRQPPTQRLLPLMSCSQVRGSGIHLQGSAQLLAGNVDKTTGQLAAAATLLVFFKGQKVMRGSQDFSFLVNMLQEVVMDMRFFLLIQAGAIFASALAFWLLFKSRSADEYEDVSTALFSSYALLMFGDGVGKQDLYNGEGTSALIPALLVLITLFVQIVMLNALIAIMGDTYARLSEVRHDAALLGRAQLLQEMERQGASDQERVNHFPLWLHTIRLVDDDDDDGSWAGQLSSIKARIDSKVDVLNARLTSTEAAILQRLDGVMDSLQVRHGVTTVVEQPEVERSWWYSKDGPLNERNFVEEDADDPDDPIEEEEEY
uniref:Ion transport domain-containing protein n=1 Tax=Haptolina brevifila TaxID=156173 RepID=A0A7S2FTK0_9EUKA|mmetsp:Transcript_19718/g.40189  ORF Transcript_19718/g.40189 Transcript_19718/m.40189 type:complete len:336 (+) Transcript_19718:312-1319(+)